MKRLGQGNWGTVELKKKVVHVGGVDDRDADGVRFHLEGLVDQANSAAIAEHESSTQKDASGTEPDGPDAELTARFRYFAEDRDDGDPESPERDGPGS